MTKNVHTFKLLKLNLGLIFILY